MHDAVRSVAAALACAVRPRTAACHGRRRSPRSGAFRRLRAGVVTGPSGSHVETPPARWASRREGGGGMRTLVLNAGYEPLAVVSFRRAIVLVLAGKATVVADGGSPVVGGSVTLAPSLGHPARPVRPAAARPDGAGQPARRPAARRAPLRLLRRRTPPRWTTSSRAAGVAATPGRTSSPAACGATTPRATGPRRRRAGRCGCGPTCRGARPGWSAARRCVTRTGISTSPTPPDRTLPPLVPYRRVGWRRTVVAEGAHPCGRESEEAPMADKSIIVVGVDETASSRRAWPGRRGRRSDAGATLQVITAWTWDAVEGAPLAVVDPQAMMVVAERTQTDGARRGARRAGHPARVAREIVQSTASEALVEASRLADLVVVGTHGRGPVQVVPARVSQPVGDPACAVPGRRDAARARGPPREVGRGEGDVVA